MRLRNTFFSNALNNTGSRVQWRTPLWVIAIDRGALVSAGEDIPFVMGQWLEAADAEKPDVLWTKYAVKIRLTDVYSTGAWTDTVQPELITTGEKMMHHLLNTVRCLRVLLLVPVCVMN